jgi:hypothetical protein
MLRAKNPRYFDLIRESIEIYSPLTPFHPFQVFSGRFYTPPPSYAPSFIPFLYISLFYIHSLPSLFVCLFPLFSQLGSLFLVVQNIFHYPLTYISSLCHYKICPYHSLYLSVRKASFLSFF